MEEPAPNEPDGTVTVFTHDGAQLVVEATGAGARTFLLVHGIGMGRGAFGDLIEHLEPHGRVLALDLPGFGAAEEPPRVPSIERLADLVAAYLRQHEPAERELVAVGHSMGTQVVTELAVRHPALVDRIVLVAPTVDAAARGALPQLGRLALDLFIESPKVVFLGAREYVRAGPRLRRKTRAMLAHRPELSYPKVTVPALVIRGENDVVCPRAWCARVAAALRTRVVEIPGHGHETMIRDAAPAARAILAELGVQPVET
ncbi:alpha/beta hydrolase [Microbacterium sp. zg-Y818]|uniref:alpha/beta fold hydrolase n=1 Tax=unclassified Microbacterium TaxID=2609290 RepID=UPI00214D0808|nr:MULTISPECIES: alpha/beta hydrolase [unclassified Microbacterium]MCR2799941.1 alpha/beta hydrolase [Microbacterium sp. zg.Y818]WIM21920.1 alpha/beta hydrolase [Microbacterium sp. zg-Y818]